MNHSTPKPAMVSAQARIAGQPPSTTSASRKMVALIAIARLANPAIALPEQQPVPGRRGGHQRHRDQREGHRHQVRAVLHVAGPSIGVGENDREQETEQDLHAGQRHPQLLEQVVDVPRQPLRLVLGGTGHTPPRQSRQQGRVIITAHQAARDNCSQVMESTGKQPGRWVCR